MKSKFGLMSEKGTIDAVFIMRRLQEEYHAKEKTLDVFCGSRESLKQSIKESVGMSIEEEMNTKSFC